MPKFSLPTTQPAIPKYRRHKASGQAVVTLSGRDHYLGPWKSKTSILMYDRAVAEWLARGREPAASAANMTVDDLLGRYWRFAKSYYRKNGEPTGEVSNIRYALRPLRALYSDLPVKEFGPLQLKAVRQKMIETGLSRPVINSRIFKILRVFKWGVAEGLLPADIHNALRTVESLKLHHTEAPEPEPIKPVADAVLDATLPHLPLVVADMVRFQRLTGCRPSEVCLLRPGDIDRCTEVWQYRPARHKMQHKDRDRVIFIGPKAQAVLLPYLLRDGHAFCFSPFESERQRKVELRARRKTKVQPSQRDRSNPNAKRKPRDHYDRCTYLTAVHRGCDKAFGEVQGPVSFGELARLAKQGRIDARDMVRRSTKGRWKRAKSVRGLWDSEANPAVPAEPLQDEWYFKSAIPRWAPNQLRHSAATEIRSRFGLEVAQILLGHARADVTQVYAERDMARATAIVREVG